MSADWELEDEEWQALCWYKGVPYQGEDCPLGLQQCIRWIAELGGFSGRKSDGAPGARTTWRGLRRLRDLVWMPTVLPVFESPPSMFVS